MGVAITYIRLRASITINKLIYKGCSDRSLPASASASHRRDGHHDLVALLHIGEVALSGKLSEHLAQIKIFYLFPPYFSPILVRSKLVNDSASVMAL